MKIKVTRKALDNKGYKASDSKGSFYFNGKLVATARYDRAGFYVFFDVNGNTVGKIKSKELSLPRDRAKAWEKLGVTFGDYMEPGETPAPVSKEEKSSDESSKRSIKVSTKAGDGAFDKNNYKFKVGEKVRIIKPNYIDPFEEIMNDSFEEYINDELIIVQRHTNTNYEKSYGLYCERNDRYFAWLQEYQLKKI